MNLFASLARERLVERDSSTKTLAVLLAIIDANLGLMFSELISMILVFFKALTVIDSLNCLIIVYSFSEAVFSSSLS